MAPGLWSLCLLVFASAVSASPLPSPEERHLELFGGYYLTDVDLFEDAFSFGGRAGYRWNRYGLEGTLSRFESDFDLTSRTGELEVLAIDLSFNLYLNPWSRYEWSLFVGPGWEFFDSSSSSNGLAEQVRARTHNDDSLSAHAGVALRTVLSERAYLRPDLRIRWYDDGSALFDVEASVAFGYSFF